MTDQQSPSLPFGVSLPDKPPREAFDASMSEERWLSGVEGSAARTIEVEIPMRDGVVLAADIHLPPASQLPAPAIVAGTPYDKSWLVEDVTAFRDAGYVGVSYDVRGRGKSEGVWHPFAADGVDGHDIVEWVAAQEWCTGKVGMGGTSYLGWVACATMAERPPHLCAVIPTSPAGRFQEELPYTYGCFWLYFGMWFAMVRRRILDKNRDLSKLLETLPIDRIGDVLEPAGPGWRELMDHDTLDELWQSRRWDGEYDFDVPCLHVTGWHDRDDIWGAFHHYEQMMATSPARDRQWLLVGPWSHLSCRFPSDVEEGVEAPGAGLDMNAIHLRFFDRFLRDEENGLEEEPRIQMYDPGDRSWKVRPEWQGGTQKRHLFLAEDGALSDLPGTDGEIQYRYDPLEPNGTLSFDPLALPLDLAGLEAQPGVLTWTGEPLQEDLTLHGWGELELWAATDGEDTEWHIKLADVDPNGLSLWVAWGCLRASYGKDARDPTPVTPGEPCAYSIELTPSFHTFKAGHRFRLILASSEFPWFARNLNRFEPIAKQEDPRVAINTVYHGHARPSSLRLPIEDRAD